MPGLGAALVRRGHEVTHFSSAWQPATDSVDGVEVVQIRRRHRDVERQEADFGRRVTRHLASTTVRRRALAGPPRRVGIAARSSPEPQPADRVHRPGASDRVRTGTPSAAATPGRWTRSWTASTCTAACHGAALEHLEREYGRGDGVVVPGGVSIDDFVPAPASGPAKPTILFSGRAGGLAQGGAAAAGRAAARRPLGARRGAVAERTGRRRPGDRRRRRRRRSRTSGLLGLGEADRQHERYGQAWLTCLPSRYDSFGMVLVESLACGTPIVTTTAGRAPGAGRPRRDRGVVCPGRRRGSGRGLHPRPGAGPPRRHRRRLQAVRPGASTGMPAWHHCASASTRADGPGPGHRRRWIRGQRPGGHPADAGLGSPRPGQGRGSLPRRRAGGWRHGPGHGHGVRGVPGRRRWWCTWRARTR